MQKRKYKRRSVRLQRAELYERISRVIGLPPAKQTPAGHAYFTKEQLRAINEFIDRMETAIAAGMRRAPC